MATELARIDGSIRELVAAGDLNIATLSRRVNLIAEIKRDILIKDEHYGTIPGCGDKPTLLQPGAQQFASLFGLVPRIIQETPQPGPEGYRPDTDGHLTFTITIRMVHPGTGLEYADGVGMCSTMESRYRYRKTERTCPSCGVAAIIKGKSEYGGGWLCWKKKDGCGAKFSEGDAAIEGQETGKVEHGDPADYWNTVRKIAYKRAMVHSLLSTLGGSGSFTQDIEDSPELYGGRNEAPPDAPPLRQPQAKAPPSQAPAAQGQPDPGVISEPQRRRLFAIATKCGVSEDDLHNLLRHNYDVDSTSKIRREDYDDIINWVEARNQTDAPV